MLLGHLMFLWQFWNKQENISAREMSTHLYGSFLPLVFCFTVDDLFFIPSIDDQWCATKAQQTIYDLLLGRIKYITSLYKHSCFVPRLTASMPITPEPLVRVKTYSCRHPNHAHSRIFCCALCSFLPCSVLIHSLYVAVRTNGRRERKGQLCWILS